MRYILMQLGKLEPRSKGFVIVAFAAFLLSLDPIFIRFSGVSGFDTAFLFGFFTSVSIPIFIKLVNRRSVYSVLKEGGRPLFISAGLMLVSASSFVLSVKYTSVVNVVIILSGAPALSALFSWVYLREKTSFSAWVSILFVILGIFIVVSGSFDSGNLLGDSLALLSVTGISLNQTFLRKHKGLSRLSTVGLGGFFIALIMFFPATPSNYSFNTWVIMGIMGLLSAPLGRVLSQVGTRYLVASEVGMIIMLEAVLAPIWALYFFNEIPSSASLLGGGIIFLTIFVFATHSFINEKKKLKEKV